jgi:hypothetical protein
MDHIDNYRSALAANNKGIGLLRQGLFNESLIVFRSAFPQMGLPGSTSTATSTTTTVAATALSCSSASGSKVTAGSACSQLRPVSEAPCIHVWDEDDLQTTCCHHTPRDGLVGIALQKLPSVGEDTTFAIQVGSFLYNFALSYLLCSKHHNPETMPSSKSLVERAKILLRHAKAVIFPKLKATMEDKMTSLSLLNLASLILNSLITVSKFENDDKSQAELFEQCILLEAFFTDAQQTNNGVTDNFTAKAA